MCPACMATAALIVASTTSAGGLTALAVKKLRSRTGARNNVPTIQTGGKENEGRTSREQDASPQSRLTE